MICVKVVKHLDPRDKTAPALYYGRVKIMQNLDLKALSEHMAKHNTPYSPGVIHGVLTDMVQCINELLLDSKSVTIGNLGTFSLSLSSGAAGSPEKWDVTDIKKVRLVCRGSGIFTGKELGKQAEFRNLYKDGLLTKDEYADAGIEVA